MTRDELLARRVLADRLERTDPYRYHRLSQSVGKEELGDCTRDSKPWDPFTVVAGGIVVGVAIVGSLAAWGVEKVWLFGADIVRLVQR